MDAKGKDDLAAELFAVLVPAYPGITVAVGTNERWNRPCITVRWAGFADLLPEERFQRLIKELPDGLREKSLSGFIWLELTPEETVDEFLRLPRSEDVDAQAGAIHRSLNRLGFYDALKSSMGRSPQTACAGDFANAIATMKKKKVPASRQRDARLLFIRQGAYCDCQIVETVRAELDKQYGNG